MEDKQTWFDAHHIIRQAALILEAIAVWQMEQSSAIHGDDDASHWGMGIRRHWDAETETTLSAITILRAGQDEINRGAFHRFIKTW